VLARPLWGGGNCCVTSESFQNKILIMILQHRAGIQYRLGSNIMNVFSNRGGLFTLDEHYDLQVNVINQNSIDLTYKAIVNEKDQWTGTPSKAFTATVTVNISPEKVTIADFNISKDLNSEATNQAFMAVKSEQQNIIMQLLTYIKHALGFDSELRLEETNERENGNSPRSF
jgi:hypothetical protein